ncbi:branched-chain amino acid ABC transporter permease [Bradyrhizobium canariense]|uniref:Branched-chain amino acid transport system permease protein n=1 Tax=Bradyrhizobium canariense TaxID=255045 RepID=A0A1H1WG37_9BRAD|nr:branched-chain amino acid ABC transporter permease [Bradyrhizobium canariense]SDS96044.1 branched-chain amino acid transport system permease protein [Bradyrhizobium canariense]
MKAGGLKQGWIWIALLVVAMMAPWTFYNYHTGRHSGFVVSMLSQMGMMSILALSYNMLLGQAGLFSLCHATFFGIGGYATIHFLNMAGAGELPLPMEIVPLLSGLSGLGLAIVFGYMATKQRATAFAMITLGIGELMVTSALMFHHFFGGEGGVNTNRMIDHSLFGLKYAHGIEVYYLILAWTLLSALAMFFLTMTPLGRMANASRDNFERVQFVGYDPRMVRFLQFALSGFFAGIGGGLYAITYEIVTFDALAAPLSANALLMAYIGGSSAFGGPILGAVLITLLQSGVSLLSNSWLVYVGVLFITMVIFAPSGIMGLVMAHAPIVRAGRLGRLAVPYLRVVAPGILMVFGFVGLVELTSFLTIGAAQGKSLILFGSKIDIHAALPWLSATACLLVGIFWLRLEAQSFRRVWESLMLELKPQRSVA